MADPQICMFFCEDAREEVGNKISLMGLLGPRIFLDENEAQSGRLKALGVGALCRFLDDEPREGVFETRFVAASDEYVVPPSPEPMTLNLAHDGDGTEWASPIVGVFNNLPVHVGMRVECTLRINDQEHRASLTIIKPGEDAEVET